MRWEKVVWVAMVLSWFVTGCAKKPTPAALNDAVRRGDVEAVKRLIARGADVNAEDGQGHTPLYVIADAGGGNVDVAEVLIAHGADLEKRCTRRYCRPETALHRAAENGQLGLVQLLIREGADVNAEGDHQGTPLHLAAEAGCEEVVEVLLSGGADLKRRDWTGRSPLHYAARSGHLGVVETLVERGADIDARGQGQWAEFTPLHEAAYEGNAEVVDLLLSKGARIDIAKEGDSLMFLAASRGLLNLAQRLIAGGVDASYGGGDSMREAALGWALAKGHTEVARLLIEHGADIHVEVGRSGTPLHVAACECDLGLVELLLARGATPDDKDENGSTPLHWAARYGSIEIAQRLIAHHADINARNYAQTTPLHCAVPQDHVDMVRVLLANGADANAREEDGDTPLHLAVARGRTEAVKLLLQCGAKPWTKDEHGVTPLDEAKRRGHAEIVELLEAIPAGSGEVATTGEKPQTETLAAEAPSSSDAEMESFRVEKVVLSPVEQARRNLKLLVRGNCAFAFDLYRQLSGRKGNLFFSPYSISTALGMTYAGARENTEAEMAQVLHIALDQAELHSAFSDLQGAMAEIQRAGVVKLYVANALWPQKGKAFLEEYLSLVKQYYGVSITPVDYIGDHARAATLKIINTWVQQKTEDKIKELLQPQHLNDATRLVLTNAIYFKGNWEHQFDPNDTEDAPFYVTVTQSVTVPMMTQTETVQYADLTDLQIIGLPYRGGELSMLVLLPKARNGLAQIERSLTIDTLDSHRRDLKECRVTVFLPKSKTTFTVELKDNLKAMGMVDAFTWPGANFGGLDGDPNWFVIGEVVHKAYVDVNEEGTEAAAATAVVMKLGGIPPKPPEFRADHPFLFLIQDNRTGSILFMGRVADPR